MPDYELKLWNESNSPMEARYIKAMYAAGKWAFVADYIRFWVLEREGGIYLDTDTEVLRSFDHLLHHGAFFGKTKDGTTAAGVIGAVPHHPVIQDIFSVYVSDTDFSTTRTSPRTVTDVLAQKEYPGVAVYDYQYFNPCDDGERCTARKLEQAYARNHWAESWVPYAGVRKFLRRLGLMSLIKSIAPKNKK